MLKRTVFSFFISLCMVFGYGSFRTDGYEEVEEIAVINQIIEEPIIEEEEIEIKDGIGTGSFITPLDGTFTSGYGERWGRFHQGIDIAAQTGTPIKAADNGEVIFVGNSGSYGLLVKLDHNNGYITYYAHCSQINVAVGDVVNQGDIISLVGNTGNSTGPHCHFEIRYDNKHKNPLEYVKI